MVSDEDESRVDQELTIELDQRQRQRLDDIKEECRSDHVPDPTDGQIFESLLDTWDAVENGYYSRPTRAGRGTTHAVMCPNCSATWDAESLYKTGDVLRCPDCDGVMRP